ncbi:MAG: UDP-3-O-(3-hydroxymyristoyl)glucosamine N-acyltransferase [Pyrinomonadaceae bacterium]
MKTREIANFLSGELRGDPNVEIGSVADLENAKTGDISFVIKTEQDVSTFASCVIIPSGIANSKFPCEIAVANPRLSFAKLAAFLHPPKNRNAEIHRSAVIAESAKLGSNVFVGAFACIGENATIGADTQLRAGAKVGDNVSVGNRCVLHANVFIEDGCSVGNDVVLHTGVVIGADGFGYVKDENGEQVKFPQIGTVVIENNVEIGANSCIDRGALGETRIGAGTKIDNLVQIAHNVRIGKNCIIVAMSGISGSSVLEDDVVLAGQVGIADHVTLKRGVVIAAKSAVFPNKVIYEGIWAGIPARPLNEFTENFAALGSLSRLRKNVQDLRNRLESTESDDDR